MLILIFCKLESACRLCFACVLHQEHWPNNFIRPVLINDVTLQVVLLARLICQEFLWYLLCLQALLALLLCATEAAAIVWSMISCGPS